MIGVYVKIDSKNKVTDIDSEIFIKKECKGDSFE